jgi:hypothetical protein
MPEPTETTAKWQPIDTAPRDGTRIMGLGGILAQETLWCKTSHVPLYGWNFQPDRDEEDMDLWHPTHWRPL